MGGPEEELIAYCLKDAGEEIMEAVNEARERSLERPSAEERKIREVYALKLLARGNATQREAAAFYKEAMKGHD